MKRKKLDSIREVQLRAVMTIVVVLGLMMLAPMVAQAGSNPNPGVLPVDSKPSGMTYGEWSAKWWQWALPPGDNPVSDTTGAFCDEGQSGNVWFLAGTWPGMSGVVTRECTIPAGKSIFFPIVNSGWFATESTETVEDGLAANKAIIDETTFLEVSVDGVPLQGLLNYRTASPKFIVDRAFGMPIEEAFGVDKVYFGISDGFWLMLAPLSAGEHTISIRGGTEVNEVNVIYHLIVAS